MFPNSYSHSVLPHQSAKKVTALAKTPLYCLFLVFLEIKSYRSGGWQLLVATSLINIHSKNGSVYFIMLPVA